MEDSPRDAVASAATDPRALQRGARVVLVTHGGTDHAGSPRFRGTVSRVSLAEPGRDPDGAQALFHPPLPPQPQDRVLTLDVDIDGEAKGSNNDEEANANGSGDDVFEVDESKENEVGIGPSQGSPSLVQAMVGTIKERKTHGTAWDVWQIRPWNESPPAGARATSGATGATGMHAPDEKAGRATDTPAADSRKRAARDSCDDDRWTQAPVKKRKIGTGDVHVGWWEEEGMIVVADNDDEGEEDEGEEDEGEEDEGEEDEGEEDEGEEDEGEEDEVAEGDVEDGIEAQDDYGTSFTSTGSPENSRPLVAAVKSVWGCTLSCPAPIQAAAVVQRTLVREMPVPVKERWGRSASPIDQTLAVPATPHALKPCVQRPAPWYQDHDKGAPPSSLAGQPPGADEPADDEMMQGTDYEGHETLDSDDEVMDDADEREEAASIESHESGNYVEQRDVVWEAEEDMDEDRLAPGPPGFVCRALKGLFLCLITLANWVCIVFTLWFLAYCIYMHDWKKDQHLRSFIEAMKGQSTGAKTLSGFDLTSIAVGVGQKLKDWKPMMAWN